MLSLTYMWIVNHFSINDLDNMSGYLLILLNARDRRATPSTKHKTFLYNVFQFFKLSHIQ